MANVNYIPWTKAPRVKLDITNKLGRKLGTTEALLDYGADLSIADSSFLKQIGIDKKMLRAPIDTEVRDASTPQFSDTSLFRHFTFPTNCRQSEVSEK